MRLRPNWYESRFGISAEQTIEAVAALASLPAEQPIGVSFHVRPQDRGARSWLEVARTFLQRAAGIERASGRAVVVFDVGGGWTPNELASVVRSELRMFVEEAPRALPNLATILLEPGQSLATPTQFMISSVVEVRRHPHHTEIVIDAGYPNLPLQGTYVHRIYVEDGGGWLLLDEGNDRILGPTCLEYDVVASNVSIPQAVRPSTKIRIADCGSYDASMAFHFARGEEESGVPCRNGRHDQGPKESQS
jgi:diaminopimelate decarboxylase